MVSYERLAATAKRLINGAGRSLTATKLATATDPSKPWEGSSAAAAASVTATAVVVADHTRMNVSLSRLSTLASDVRSPAQVCLWAALDDGGYDLQEFDHILDTDGSTWLIKRSELVKPGGVSIMYVLEVVR